MQKVKLNKAPALKEFIAWEGEINTSTGKYNKKLNVLNGKKEHKCCMGSKKQKISTWKIKKGYKEVGFEMGPKDRKGFKKERKGWGHSRR